MVVKEGVVQLFNRIAVMPELEGPGGSKPYSNQGVGAYSAHSLLPASLNRIHLVNLEKEKCKIDQRLLL